ncbi:ROK family protein [Opitutus sp. ER46]|uniref:ROK family protein n=1 Tax=Opitutus sp. ER46 TaxID=2161864 RepID=UPI000D3048A9|nr:ROK family protein [Opitutus sp. ER46]PTX94662.1 sugar kinase [Opitutus sp. ER46]
MHDPALIGIDLGGTKCAVSVTDGDKVREVARFASDLPRPTLERLHLEIERLHPGPDVVFGVSCGGPLDAARGLILSPPNLPGWDRVDICQALTRRHGGRAALMNDANACALAEWQYGAGRGARNMVFLTMGTGMGAGLILDGRLYEGTNGNAGEVGHIRLQPEGPIGYHKAGSFEGFCSGGGIAQLAHRVWPKAAAGELSAREVATAANLGDPAALQLWTDVGTHLGEALAILVDVLNPDRIVIGSIYARCERFIARAMQDALRREALAPSLAVCSVVPAALGEQIGSYGAISVARHAAQAPR